LSHYLSTGFRFTQHLLIYSFNHLFIFYQQIFSMTKSVEITKAYYDSKEVDEFYHKIWGGEDIHIGTYISGDESIEEASRQTILKMLKQLPTIKKGHRILDLGAGYGGAARFLAQEYNCRVDCLNLSEIQNKRNIEKTKAAELEKYISITAGNFEQIPFDRETYDIVWSQDALLHSNDKVKIFREVARVLKPEGRFIFTDPMQSKDCPADVLKEALERLHLEDLGSVNEYKSLANRADLEQVLIKRMPEQLTKHYAMVLKKLKQYEKTAKKSNRAFLKKTMTGIEKSIEMGEKGYLTWGILQFQKRNE